MMQMAEILSKKLGGWSWECSERVVVIFFGGLKHLVEGRLPEIRCRVPQDT